MPARGGLDGRPLSFLRLRWDAVRGLVADATGSVDGAIEDAREVAGDGTEKEKVELGTEPGLIDDDELLRDEDRDVLESSPMLALLAADRGFAARWERCCCCSWDCSGS